MPFGDGKRDFAMSYRHTRTLWLYDIFEGMIGPTKVDLENLNREAIELMNMQAKKTPSRFGVLLDLMRLNAMLKPVSFQIRK